MALLTPALKYALSMMLAGVSFPGEHSAVADGARLVDLSEHAADPFDNGGAKLLAFVFVRIDCPISNAYAPEIRRLHDRFAPRGVVFRLIYVGKDESSPAIYRHLRDFQYPCGALRDPQSAFARKSRVSVTPEAALFRPDGTLLYHGRIDDRYVDFGKARPEAKRHDLAEALALALAGKPVPPAAGPTIGCFIEEVK
jgi:hypothetical protein